MKSRLIVFTAIFLLSVTMNSCEKSDAFVKDDPKSSESLGMPQTLVQTVTIMDCELENWKTEDIQTAAENFLMLIEQIGCPSMNPYIVIGCNVIYPRGEPMYRLKKKEEDI